AHFGDVVGIVNCAAGDFPKLQVLHLINFDGRWKIEEGAMPHIRQCNIPERMLIRD
ncbi:hypothetical protein PIB30_072011, partial [Stylosanthes scabra]|nr:hypothetical protein [Stylosanthes scabra]